MNLRIANILAVEIVRTLLYNAVLTIGIERLTVFDIHDRKKEASLRRGHDKVNFPNSIFLVG